MRVLLAVARVSLCENVCFNVRSLGTLIDVLARLLTTFPQNKVKLNGPIKVFTCNKY